jgi:hypothetical protein
MQFILTLFVLFFLVTCRPKSPSKIIRIGFIDSVVCPEKLKVNLGAVYYSTPWSQDPCANFDPQLKNQQKFHGHQILELFFSMLNPKIAWELFPTVVFNEKGQSHPDDWISSINYLQEKKVDFIFSASGLILNNHPAPQAKFNVLSFFPAGQKGLGVHSQTELWPQQFSVPNTKIIGYYLQFPGAQVQLLYPVDLINEKQIDFLVWEGPINSQLAMRATSAAVARASALFINACHSFFPDQKSMNNCLNQKLQSQVFVNKSEWQNILSE